MAIILEAKSGSGPVQRIRLGPGRVKIGARPGETYRLIDEAGTTLEGDISVKRVGDDLVIEGLPKGQIVELGRFYSVCTPEAPCALVTATIGGRTGETITPSTPALATLTDRSELIFSAAAGGLAPAPAAPAVAAPAVPPVTASPAPTAAPTPGPPAPATATEAAAPAADAGGVSPLAVAAGVGGLLLAAAAGGGGGGSGDAVAGPAPAPAPAPAPVPAPAPPPSPAPAPPPAPTESMRGTAGNDTFDLDAAAIAKLTAGTLLIDGLDGFDTLRLRGSGVTLDLTEVPDENLNGIERISFDGPANTLTLVASDVLDLGGTLVIDGNSNDTVNAPGFARVTGPEAAPFAEADFVLYRHGSGAQLLIDEDISRINT